MDRAFSSILKFPVVSRSLRVLSLVFCAFTIQTVAGQAQSTPEASGAGASYINPFPPGDVYKLQVYGDEYVEGLLQGLSESFKPEDRLEFTRKPRMIGTLIRTEFGEEIKIEEQSKDVFHVAVVMLGLNDRGSMRTPGSASIKFGTAAWKEQYGQRLERFLKALKRRNMAVYVVGLPPLRRSDANQELEAIGETLVEKSFASGIRLIEVAEAFADENGAFSQFGPDVSGNRAKLRDGDGIGFTNAGYRKLASLVATEIKRDLQVARSERAVPLAGGEAEQRRINPDKAGSVLAAAALKSPTGKDVRDSSSANSLPATNAVVSSTPPARAIPVNGEQKAETSRISLRLPGISGREDVVQVEIVRPAISAAVIALLTRRDAVDAGQQPYELLVDDVGDGVSVSTMVTSLSDVGSNGRRKGATTQAAYSAVWVRGERLQTKLGRADDFSWSPPDNSQDVLGNNPPLAGPNR